jgi:hypothetical protein
VYWPVAMSERLGVGLNAATRTAFARPYRRWSIGRYCVSVNAVWLGRGRDTNNISVRTFSRIESWAKAGGVSKSG